MTHRNLRRMVTLAGRLQMAWWRFNLKIDRYIDGILVILSILTVLAVSETLRCGSITTMYWFVAALTAMLMVYMYRVMLKEIRFERRSSYGDSKTGYTPYLYMAQDRCRSTGSEPKGYV